MPNQPTDSIHPQSRVRPPAVVDKPIRFEVKTFIDDMRCGVCHTGRLRPTAEPAGDSTLHTCTKCGRQTMVKGDPYPRTVVEHVQVI